MTTQFRLKVGVLTSLALFSSGSLASAERRTQLNDHWGVLGEFVYMRRAHSSDKGLVYDLRTEREGCECDFSVLRTKTLINRMEFTPGVRGGLTYRPNQKRSFEASGLYLWPWKGRGTRLGHGDTLLYPFHTGTLEDGADLRHDAKVLAGRGFVHDFFDAGRAEAEYKAQFWDAELNYWRHFNPRWSDYFSLSGIVGLRYFHYRENLKSVFFRKQTHSDSEIRTRNRMYGLQLGVDLQINPMSYFSWDFAVKVGVMVDDGKQWTNLRDDNNRRVLRHYARGRWQDGVFADCSALMAFNLMHHIDIHAGYEFLYLSGIATAEDQLSQKVPTRKRVHTHGVAIIHGLFVGMVLNF